MASTPRLRINTGQLIYDFEYSGLSGHQLAKVAGVSHTTIQNYLSGVSKSCPVSVAGRIEKALQVPRESIFTPQPSDIAA